nr:protein regulator of cytokinesis 1-like [Leptinotarsa decemlineata]
METSSLRKRFTDLQDLDMDMIKGITWAEQMWRTLLTGLTKTFLNWTQVALKMSNNEEDLQEWVQVFTEHYEDTCCELVSDIEYLKSTVIANIENLLQRVESLCKTLKIEMPVLDIDSSCLYKVQHQLKKRVEELEHSVETRRRDLNKLRQKQLELCKSLGREPRVIDDNPLPSSDEILDFQNHIERLEQEKFDRFEKFCLMKEEISLMTRELNVSPSTEFEKNVLSQDDSKFMVTDENMKDLECFHKSIKRQLENVKEEISHLRSNVDHYWDLLEISLQERQEFRQKYTGNSVDVLDALRLEVRRCGDLKKANIKVFVDKLRNELTTIWEQCHCSESAKEDFSYYISDCYTEDLLELHEIELKKWKAYYEENKEMILLLNKHMKLWNKMIELEESATGPDRYNNRGGKLLKEEKERNLLSKQIPKIEDTLRELAYKYEKHHGYEFRTFNKTIEEYIYNMHSDRENARKEKLSARKIQREQPMLTLTPAKSALCLFPGSITPSTMCTSKRKLFDNPSTDLRKKIKTSSRLVATEPKKNKKGIIPKIILSTTSQSKRLSTERKKRIEKIRRQSVLKQRNNNLRHENVSSTESEYMNFENEVSSRVDCRSTINPFLVPLPDTPAPATKTPVKSISKQGSSHRTRPDPGTPTNPKFSAAKTNLRMNF